LNTKSKHILIVASEFPPQPGGIGNHAYNLARHLQRHHFLVDVIADCRSFSGDEERIFDDNLNFKVHRIVRRKLRALMYLKRIISLFKLIKTSEVVIASGKFSLWMVAFSSLFYNKKFIAILHGSEVNYSQKFLKHSINWSLKRFSKLIAVSNYTKSLVSHLNHQGIVVIPNGFDTSKWNLKNTQTLNLNGQPKLITVGNVTNRKGQLNVINMLPELIKNYPEIHYHCVGIPTQKEEFISIALKLKVETHITFHGKVSDSHLQELLQSSDVFVMLSNPTQTGDVEGFGIAIIEANALGLPSIGSINCGIEDAISNKKSGILVTYNDSEVFLKALNEILSKYENYKFEAKQWAKQHTWETIIKQYIKEINL